MLNQLNLERRKKPRKKLSGLLPGRLYLKSNRLAISARPIDVSPNGLGLLSSDGLPLGAIVLLEMKEQTIELKVSWTRPDFGKKNMFRYGLEPIGEANLEEIFSQKGCLK